MDQTGKRAKWVSKTRVINYVKKRKELVTYALARIGVKSKDRTACFPSWADAPDFTQGLAVTQQKKDLFDAKTKNQIKVLFRANCSI